MEAGEKLPATRPELTRTQDPFFAAAHRDAKSKP